MTMAKPRMHDYYESYEASVDDDVQDNNNRDMGRCRFIITGIVGG